MSISNLEIVSGRNAELAATGTSGATRVAIVGAGCSGVLTAIHLLRQDLPVTIDMIDPRPEPGPGLAYSTVHRCHLLNVPAARISAFPAQPNHFLHWFRANRDPQARPDSFAPRTDFGTYLQELLADALRGAAGVHEFRYHPAEAVSIRQIDANAVIVLKGGVSIFADFVVLATGNPPPRSMRPDSLGADERYFDSAWEEGALGAVAGNRSREENSGEVLLIGSGLTAVDAALALRGQGFDGVIHMVSRRGLLPQGHRAFGTYPHGWRAMERHGLRHILRHLREHSKTHQGSKRIAVPGDGSDGTIQSFSAPGDWREVIDSLRPATNRIWRHLSLRDRQRFHRHLKAYWDVHRHRMAPNVCAQIEELAASGRLRVHAGRLLKMNASADGIQVELAGRGGKTALGIRVQRVINCTGPENDYRKSRTPLIASLIEEGYAMVHPSGAGLASDGAGAALEATGEASEWLFLMGHLRNGELLETVAVPELRSQAAQVAARIREHLEESVQEWVSTSPFVGAYI